MKYNIYRVLSILALIVLTTNSSFASSTTVTNPNDNLDSGTLRSALTVLEADTVFFDPGVTTITLTSQITIIRDVVIIGNGINETILSGGNSTRLLASNFKIYISSMTIRDGFSSDQGGGLFSGGKMTIENVLFTNNKATTDGGAIITTGLDTMTLINVTLDNNHSLSTNNGRGGAIFIRNAATLIMEDCQVTNNSAMFSAGAISSTVTGGEAKLFMNRCILSGNHSPNGGGGMVIFGDTVRISNSLITGNEANSGAGLYFGSLVTDPTLNVFIYNSTIAGNLGSEINGDNGRGAGIFIWNNTNLYMTNTIVGNNTLDIGTLGPDIYFEGTGTFHDLGGNLISDSTNINTIDPIISIVDIDPQFVEVVDTASVPTTLGDYRLRCSSPAIDMGKDTLGLTMGVDVAGLPRLINGTIDIGAHERQLETSYMVTNTADNGIGSLRNAVNLSCPGDTVFFDPMIDSQEITLTTGQIEIDSNIVIFGNGPSNTIVDGNGTSRIFEINIGASVTISNMTIQNGNSTNQTSGAGGGLFNDQGNLKLSDVHVMNCTASDAGGLHTQNGGTSHIQRCLFSNNSVSRLGGGLTSEGVTTILNSVISGNSAGQGGGGIYISNTASLTNVTISGNRALSGSGGGISHDGILLTMTNTIVAKNESSSPERDIHKSGSVAVFTDDGYNLLGDTTGIGQPLVATSIFGTSTTPLDPIFFLCADFTESEPGDMRLRCASPALNAGTPDTSGLGIGLLDVSGLSRIVNNIVDIGAHERPVETAIREVVNNNDSGAGSLREAIVTACTEDIVEIAEGVDGQMINIRDELVIDTDLDIIGNGIDNTIINGGSSSRIFHIKQGVTSNISSMKIIKGRPDFPMNGGGIKNEGEVTIDDMVIENCSTSGNGGGIYNSSTGVITINQMFIDECQANEGGGIYNSPAGVLTFNNSTIYKSLGGDNGGGVFNAGQASLDRSAISANLTITKDGGGVYNLGNINLTNSTISANEGGFDFEVNGGGIYNDGIFTITNSTVAGNKADHGGGIFNDSTFTMTNTIIAKNISDMGPDIRSDTALITDNGYNLIGDTSSLQQALHATTLFGDQTMPLDPLFLKDARVFDNNLGDIVRDPGNLRLACVSPAVDMGTPNTTGLGIGTIDILGLPRIADTRVDIGAHERISASITPIVTNTDDSGLGTLRDEILSVCSSDTLFFDAVTDGDTIYLTSDELLIDKGITIIGNGQDETFIDGINNKRIFYIDSENTVDISTLSILNGRAQDEFGILENGGGIYVESGRLNLESVSITNCEALDGGGLYNADTITLSNSSISSNIGRDGGGICNVGLYASFVNSTIEDNTSSRLGGGVYTERTGSYATFINTVISLNTSFFEGGGVGNNLGTVTFTNATISGNTASDANGGGVSNVNGGTAIFANTIAANNLGNVSPDIYIQNSNLIDQGNNFIGNATNVVTHFDMSTLLGTQSTPLDPNFVRDADMETGDPGDLRLWCTSQAVDAGVTDTTGLQVGLVDLQGSTRIVGNAIDIGAYEYFAGHTGDLLLDGTAPIKALERSTNITAEVGVSQSSTLFQVEETVSFEHAFEVDDGKAFEVQVENCPE